ncbi:MAG: DUF1186 domain-containing protein [Planctomycetota bacterium]
MDRPSTDGLSEDEIGSIIGQLTTSDVALSSNAFTKIREYRAQFTPHLIKLIEDATRDVREGRLLVGNAHSYATYLLAEFGETEAWPAIRAAISLPDERPFDLYDEGILEHFHVIIASLVGERSDQIDELIAKEEINLCVRWACIDAMFCQIRDGVTTREAVIARLGSLLREAIDRTDEIAETIVLRLDELGAESLLPLVEEAYAKELADTDLLDLDEFKENVAKAQDTLPQKLDDLPSPDELIAQLDHSSAFRDVVIDDELDDDFISTSALPASDWHDSLDDVSENETTVRNDEARVGRNERCPCGSGKKYKKCCGRSSGLGAIGYGPSF